MDFFFREVHRNYGGSSVNFRRGSGVCSQGHLFLIPSFNPSAANVCVNETRQITCIGLSGSAIYRNGIPNLCLFSSANINAMVAGSDDLNLLLIAPKWWTYELLIHSLTTSFDRFSETGRRNLQNICRISAWFLAICSKIWLSFLVRGFPSNLGANRQKLSEIENNSANNQ